MTHAKAVLDAIGGVGRLAATGPAEIEASELTRKARERVAAVLELGRRLAGAKDGRQQVLLLTGRFEGMV